MMIDDVGQAERMAPMIACSVSVSRARNGSSRTKTSGGAATPGEREPLALTAGEVSAAWADLWRPGRRLAHGRTAEARSSACHSSSSVASALPMCADCRRWCR